MNDKHTLRLTLAVIAVAIGLVVSGSCRNESVSGTTVEIVADSVRDFSGEQGANGWFYGYWDRTADSDRNYDQKTDLQLLEHYGSDPKNHLSRRREFNTGELWNLQDGRYYTSLWAEGGHPNGTRKLGDYARVEHWVVRRWVSSVDGPVTISGHSGKVMPWGANWEGGCQAMIVVDGEVVYAGAMDNQGTDYSIDVAVQTGSLVDFLIGPDPSVGVTTLTAIIRTTQHPSQ